MNTITTDAVFDTIPLEDAKKQLRIWHGDFDREVKSALHEAVDYCERVTGRTLRTAVARRKVLSCWKDIGRFEFQPVIAVSQLAYLDTDDAEQIVAASNYRLIASTDSAAFLELDDDFTRPEVSDRSDAIRIDYTTGYAALADIPPAAIRAIKLMLTVYWGDLAPQMMEVWQRRADAALAAIEWGAYR